MLVNLLNTRIEARVEIAQLARVAQMQILRSMRDFRRCDVYSGRRFSFGSVGYIGEAFWLLSAASAVMTYVVSSNTDSTKHVAKVGAESVLKWLQLFHVSSPQGASRLITPRGDFAPTLRCSW